MLWDQDCYSWHSKKLKFKQTPFSDDIFPECNGPAERFPQMILLGYSAKVIQMDNFTDCYERCFNSVNENAFPCNSFQFYYDAQVKCLAHFGASCYLFSLFQSSAKSAEKNNEVFEDQGNCILNYITKEDRPDLYMRENNALVDYVEMNC